MDELENELEQERNISDLRKQLGWQDFVNKLGQAAAMAGTIGGKTPQAIDLSSEGDQRQQILSGYLEDKKSARDLDRMQKKIELEKSIEAKYAQPKPKTYDQVTIGNKVYAVDKNDPSNKMLLGEAPKKDSIMKSITGYVAKGTTNPVEKSDSGEIFDVVTGKRISEIEPMPAKPPASVEQSKKETLYRYNALKQNAQELKDIVKEYGTFELFGDAESKMDSKIYQMAVDYAKLVDPDSVAREGEVAAAQKYMLPFRKNMGASTKNETALKQIDNYLKDLDSRLMAREQGQLGIAVAGPKSEPPPGGPGVAVASEPTKKIKIQAPDGSVAEVPESKKDYYIKKGGKVVQ